MHVPVMLAEALRELCLSDRGDGIWIDGTFGVGGHSAAMLQRMGPSAHLLAMDKDPAAAAIARERFADEPRFHFRLASFATLEQQLASTGLQGPVRGVLLDLGVSSVQLDQPARGFSFLRDGPLDMRMNPDSGSSAAEWLVCAREDEIDRVLRDFGEERYHRRIAKAIVSARSVSPIATTGQLAEIVAAAVPRWEKHKHPATRTFQAIRISVNRELDDLAAGLQQAVKLLAASGRLVVISFHSLEDRLVKTFMRTQTRAPALPRRLPVTAREEDGVLRLIGKPLKPTAEEVRHNPRARSATMRVAERRP
jgi:16S rRNA (cytosine1402-N4)-methyltransferase